MTILPDHDVSSQAYKKARRQYQKSTKIRDSQAVEDLPAFRAAEKKYKVRFPPPDLSSVLDLALLDEIRTAEVVNGGWKGRPDALDYTELRLKERQRDLVRWALRDHALPPNETNLDTHYLLPEGGLWNSHIQSLNSDSQVPDIQPRASVESHLNTLSPIPPGPRQLISNTPATTTNVHSLTMSASAQPVPAPSLTVTTLPPSALVRKLRWANIGWFYHWGTKQYDFTRGKVEVAPQIREICQSAVDAIIWEDVFGKTAQWKDDGEDWRTWNETYEPDAGIVNFYQTKDTLMAHVDRSEVCATTPLVSISLGCAAIFLIGGLTRDIAPIPVLLRSGDVVIMSGPECRRAYHGVPRILEESLPPHLGSDPNAPRDVSDEWKPFQDYLHSARININVRQVFPKGFTPGW